VDDLTAGNRAEDDAVVVDDVVHRQDAGAFVNGVGKPPYRFGGEQLQALCAVEVDEPRVKLKGCPKCVVRGVGGAGRYRRRLLCLGHVWCAF
jgi:hypothetical protein